MCSVAGVQTYYAQAQPPTKELLQISPMQAGQKKRFDGVLYKLTIVDPFISSIEFVNHAT